MTTPSIPIIFFSIALCANGLSRDLDLEQPSSKLRRFASDVIFEVEAGDREKYSKRLPGEIELTLQCNPTDRQLVLKHLAPFLELTGVRVAEPAKAGSPAPAKTGEPAKLTVWFGKKNDLARIAAEIDRQINLERGYSYWKWWNGSKIITRAVIFIATDKVAAADIDDRLIEQLLGVFGLPSKSNEIDESCLTSKNTVFNSLQPVDKALLGFYYRAVPAGTKPREFDVIFREKWNEKR